MNIDEVMLVAEDYSMAVHDGRDEMNAAQQTEQLNDAAEYVCNAREFCGNETQALLDWQADNRALTKDERRIVSAMVSQRWGQYQKAAGVTAPIPIEERAQITRMFERAACFAACQAVENGENGAAGLAWECVDAIRARAEKETT